MVEENYSSIEVELAKRVVASATPGQRQALLAWATELEAIRKSPIQFTLKVRLAMKATVKRRVIAPVLKGLRGDVKQIASRTKVVLWDNLAWPARLGMVGLTVGTLGLSSEAAGLAVFGRAIAVPVWLVLTAGGTLLGAIIQELQKVLANPSTTTTYTVIEARADRDA
jgi:hypothetical protein